MSSYLEAADDESDEVAVCPHDDCGSSSITFNSTGDDFRGRDADHDKYRCADCGRYFDEPDFRERQGHSNGRGKRATDLLQADPDEFPK